MAFTYTGLLDTALDRVRYAVGDIASPGFFPDATYQALLTAASDNETAAARAAASGLAAFYATKPSDVGLPSGLRVAWSERIAQWNKIALGQAGAAQPQATTGPKAGRLTAGADYEVR